MMLPSVTSGRSLKEKTIGFTQQMKKFALAGVVLCCVC
ncbi:hypothetical protein LTSEMON_5156 [Salmonella enterica subsp. enterica serovar Montevideo str. S5-403]|uniref:Uncharacterized protein n=1 Tax=Salmonella enterica subsp. enterica serovar Montevideo str. S5-403 TaxID=913242 RepID=G5Q9P4_SALMO|nr:hypothetical protein LTSEMON_5156 [Salmonella enterica subsp. enterica serovar Montevideo str. S5-403]